MRENVHLQNCFPESHKLFIMEQNHFNINFYYFSIAETRSPSFVNNLSVRTDMLRIQRYHIVRVFDGKNFGEFLFVCFLYLCHKTLLRIWTVKFGEPPVIHQGFPPPRPPPIVHTIWYVLLCKFL